MSTLVPLLTSATAVIVGRAGRARRKAQLPRIPRDVPKRVSARNELPAVSVVVPVKDTPPDLLRTAVRSAVRQDADVPIEIIVRDDGSTRPDTLAALRSLPVQQEPGRPVVVCRSATNRGISAARNTACARARGDWYLWLDSDDQLPRDAVRRLLSAAVGRTRLVLGPCLVVLPDGRQTIHRSEPFLRQWRVTRRKIADPLLSAVFAVHGGLVHHSLFWETGGFDERRRYAELTEWFLRVMTQVAPDEVGLTTTPTYTYVKRAGSHSADREILERHRREVLRQYGLSAGLRTESRFVGRCNWTGARLYDLLTECGVSVLRPATSPSTAAR